MFIVVLGVFENLDAGRSAFTGITFREIMWSGLGLDFTRHPLLVPFWYIRCLMIITIVSPVLVWMLRRWRWYVPLMILPVYLYCCGIREPHVMPWFLFYSPFSLAGWLYFSIGVLVRVEGRFILSCRPHLGLLLPMALAVVAAGRIACYWRLPAVAGCLWLLGIPLLLLCVWRLIPARPFPDWFVTAAFPVYAMHYFFAKGLETLVFPIAHPAWWAYVLRALAMVTMSFTAATLMRRLLPRESRILFGGR